jgi:hypothetical protein
MLQHQLGNTGPHIVIVNDNKTGHEEYSPELQMARLRLRGLWGKYDTLDSHRAYLFTRDFGRAVKLKEKASMINMLCDYLEGL